MMQQALDYAAGGALVLPLHTPTPNGCSCRRRDCTSASAGKHPRTMRGFADATADPEIVRVWWSMWPDANIGIRPAPGLVVVDVDPRHGGDVQLAAMQDRHGALPTTRTARTGGGGWHLWFAAPGPFIGALARGLDIKAGGSGYVVAPPSLHACGGGYAWTDPGPIAPAPEWLRQLLKPPAARVPAAARGGATQARAAGLLRVVAEAAEGERNRRLYWAARRAVEHGIDVNPLLDAAVELGLTRREAERTAASAARAGGATR